jgi:DNA-binding transcriptional LysR family regulator
MNIHHLELFYFVARHRGIAEAVRNMPYGIQQPAISSQILQLEESLGITLFRRRPFELTPSGKALYEFIEPFFSGLGDAEARIRGDTSQRLCLAASQTVLRDYLPDVLVELRKQFPKLHVRLVEGFQQDLIELVQAREVDLAVIPIDPPPPGNLKCTQLLELPLVLLVPKTHPLKSATDLWERERIEEILIALPSQEAMCRAFYRGLADLGAEWLTGIEVSSVQLVLSYVQRGFGLGLSVAEPNVGLSDDVRALPLNGFPLVRYGVVWHSRLPPVAQALMNTLVERARALIAPK